MRRLTIILLVLIAAINTGHAAEPDTLLPRISAQIDQHAVIRAEFTQEKRMPALKRPLITSGHFVFSRRHGVLWQIEHPYRMIYVLGEERMLEIGADGARRQRSLREIPGLTQVGRIFRALLSANASSLHEIFNITTQGQPAHWEVQLKPRDAQLAQFLSSLNLSGGRFVEAIGIDETGGDTTRIRFRNASGSETLSDTEVQLFGPLTKP